MMAIRPHLFFSFLMMLLIIILGSSAQAQLSCRRVHLESDVTERFQINEASRSLSQVIRDNHRDYVYFLVEYTTWLKTQNTPEARLILEILKQEGWIPGDNHGGNYTVTMKEGVLVYRFVDVKDAGIGPYLYSIANLVLNTHAVAREGGLKIKQVTRQLMDAYLQGLRGENRATPRVIRQALETDPAQYESWRHEDAERFLNKHNRFRFKEGRIEELKTQVAQPERVLQNIRESLAQLPEKVELLDVGVRPKDRGGSKDLLRIWAVVRREDRSLQIMEFKQIEMSSAQVYRRSGLSIEDHTNRVIETFDISDSWMQTAWLDGQLFLMRPRKIELVSIPYKQRNARETEELMAMTSHAAYQNGLHQRGQGNGSAYLGLVENNRDAVELAIRNLIKAYYQRLEIKLEDG